MKVKRYDYADQFRGHLEEVVDTFRTVLLDGSYVLSHHVECFEDQFARFLGVPHVVGVNSGTDALILALMACEVGPGDEVITAANTFHATVAAICMTGATPVLVDPGPETFLLQPKAVASAVTGRTKAIVPVHLYGKACPLGEILTIAQRAGAFVIEDAAQAHGARSSSGEMAGTRGHMGCFSFHPSKNLAAAGDAGAVCTTSDHLATRLRMLRALGQRGQNEHLVVGINSKLDALQAIVLTAKLPLLDAWNADRARTAALYRGQLSKLPLGFQRADEGEQHVFHLFQIRTSKRDALLAHLTSHGIEATIRYPTPIHLQPAFADLRLERGRFPVAETLAAELMTLPIRPQMPFEEVAYVVETVASFWRGQ
jgi:dTDP-4-amino-4,6-dideoxygalactose transaminase